MDLLLHPQLPQEKEKEELVLEKVEMLRTPLLAVPVEDPLQPETVETKVGLQEVEIKVLREVAIKVLLQEEEKLRNKIGLEFKH